MTQTILNQMLDQLKTLEAEELRQLDQAIQKQLLPQEETRKREAFHQALLTLGLVKLIKKPRHIKTPRPPLVIVQGKPVSETIIEERR